MALRDGDRLGLASHRNNPAQHHICDGTASNDNKSYTDYGIHGMRNYGVRLALDWYVAINVRLHLLSLLNDELAQNSALFPGVLE